MASKTCLDFSRDPRLKASSWPKAFAPRINLNLRGFPPPPLPPCQNKIYQHHDVFYALCMMMMMMMMMMMNVGYQLIVCCFSLLLFLFVEFVVAEFIKVNVSQSVSTNLHPTFKYLKHGNLGTTINCRNTF